MDKQLLKRRVIGATVLVALGVIFIPMILSGGRDNMPLFGSNIPDKPKAIERLKSVEIPSPALVAKNEEIRIPVDEHLAPANIEQKKFKAQPKPTTDTQKDDATVATVKTKSSNLKAWVVQVGSFAKRTNALALQKKLRKHQFPAFVEFIKNQDGSIYRVRVGPEVKQAKAEAAMQTIYKKLKIKGVVMSHP